MQACENLKEYKYSIAQSIGLLRCSGCSDVRRMSLVRVSSISSMVKLIVLGISTGWLQSRSKYCYVCREETSHSPTRRSSLPAKLHHGPASSHSSLASKGWMQVVVLPGTPSRPVIASMAFHLTSRSPWVIPSGVSTIMVCVAPVKMLLSAVGVAINTYISLESLLNSFRPYCARARLSPSMARSP